jgi:opacity protein-like surface antigen
MRVVSVPLLLFAVPATAYAQEAQTPEASADVQRWDISVAAGVSSVTMPMPGMEVLGTVPRRTMSGTNTDSSLETSLLVSLRYRIGERVVWSVPTLSFAYLGGEAGEREWIPWGGLTGWGVGYSSVQHLIVQGDLGAGIGLREWIHPSFALNVTGAATSAFSYQGEALCPVGMMCPSWQGPTTWVGSATAGVSHRIADRVTFNLGVGVSHNIAGDSSGTTVSFGSVQALALRQLPLLQAQLSQRWSLDGYALGAYDRTADRIEQRYLVGFTRVLAAH